MKHYLLLVLALLGLAAFLPTESKAAVVWSSNRGTTPAIIKVIVTTTITIITGTIGTTISL
jgi:hypothetical protein